MGFDAGVTILVTGAALAVLWHGRVAPDAVLVGALTVLLVTRVLDVGEALAGFANAGVVTIGALYVVVAGLRETGGVDWIARRLLGRTRSLRVGTLRFAAPVAAMSALLNNTPIVAMLVPAVRSWAQANGIAPSKVMIPLSYAAILGGTITLIGTSTNLVVDGLLRADGRGGLAVLEIAWVGIPTAIVGIAFLILVGPRLLPDRQGAATTLEDPRQYSVEMHVAAGGPLAGITVEQAGLRHLSGLFLVEIDREGTILPVVGPAERLHAGDRLVFVGIVDSVVELQRIHGLLPAKDQVFKLDGERNRRVLIEAVVSDSSPVAGRTIRESRFRSRYDAVVVAVARGSERLVQKLGDIVLRPGDTLLLEARPTFVERMRHVRDFYLINQLADSRPFRHDRALVAGGILVAMVAVAATGLLSMLEASLLAAGAMVLSRSLQADVARNAIEWRVLTTVAAAFALGAALDTSGVATMAATALANAFADAPMISLALIYLITATFSAVITNNAAVVLAFPIAMGLADSFDASPIPFAITVMMAGSASFATPIGYQTNLMVWGPGGYRFADFVRIGLPMTFVTATVSLLVIPRVWPL